MHDREPRMILCSVYMEGPNCMALIGTGERGCFASQSASNSSVHCIGEDKIGFLQVGNQRFLPS